MDLSQFSTDDLKALQTGDLSKVSTAGLKMLQAPSPGSADSLRQPDGSYRMSISGTSSEDKQATALDQYKRGQTGSVLGLARGFADVGDTLLNGASRFLPQGYQDWNAERHAGLMAMDSDNAGNGQYAGHRVAGNVLATAPVGGALAAGAKAVGVAAPVVSGLASGGFSAGKAAPGVGGFVANQLTRAGSGAVVGGASTALIDPDVTGTGAAIGAALPAGIQALGKAGAGAASLYRWARGANGGEALARALEVASPAEAQAIVAKLRAAPELVPGSRPTVAQALRTPEASTLEQVVSDSPGGGALKATYMAQDKARINALERHGAQTYTGAPSEEATLTGDKIGAVLRTQAGDDAAAERAAWEALTGRASREGTTLRLPLDEMRATMNPLGRGTVGEGAQARSLMNEAQNIGTLELPAVKPAPDVQAQSLAQAVRKAGGIKDASGEVRDLGIKQSGTTGLVNNRSGKTLDMMAEEMHRRGFIGSADPDELVQALRSGSRALASDAPEGAFQRGADAAMGDLPQAERVPVAVPFEEFQRLRRSAGVLGANAADKAPTEAGVLGRISEAMTNKADSAAAGNLLHDESMSSGFGSQYNAARGMTRSNAERYSGGNNIEAILRKPYGQDYKLTGDEITNKLWHGGTGLAGDVANLKQVLTDNNLGPVFDSLQKFVMTDAAGKTTKAGNLAAALPRYVETRMSGLRESLTPEQLQTLVGVADDIKRAAQADAAGASKGSPTYRNAANALSLGLLDAPGFKAAASRLPFGAASVDMARGLLGKSKAKVLANALSDSGNAANALEQLANSGALSRSEANQVMNLLGQSASRTAPALLANRRD